MARPDDLSFDSLTVHAGQVPDSDFGSRAVPIHQTTSFVFQDTDHAASLYNLESPGHIYSRISNPTVAVFEERMAALEGGVGAIATASGHAALHLAIVTLMGQGGHIVASRALYGGSVNFLTHTLPRFGITTTFVPHDDPDAWSAAITDDTRMLLTETLGNPKAQVSDIPVLAAIGHSAGVPLLVDNTFASPALFRPFERGADLVLHSATKFIGGHGIAIGGVLVDSGRFPWDRWASKYPTLTEGYAPYDGLVFTEEYGPGAFNARARVEGLRDFGATLAPQNAFYFLQGLETLHVRMERHVENALRVAEFLEAEDGVAWVSHPGLPSHPDHDVAARLLPDGAGAVFAFGVKGGRAAGRALIESVRLWSHLANVGDAKSLLIHPASTTHQQMSAEELDLAGIGEELIRVSVGIEDVGDLIGDLRRAIRASQR